MPNTREFSDAPLPDKRLRRRLEVIGAQVASEPAATFPQMARSDGELEAIYRFLNNPRVSSDAILEPHVQATQRRARGHATIGIVHDTTQFVFNNVAGENLGYLPNTHQRGFFCHVALAVDDRGHALGVLGAMPYFFATYNRGARKQRQRDYSRVPEKKSARWPQLVNKVESLLPDGCQAVHIMDREADQYALVAEMTDRHQRFVIRMCRNRPANEQGSVEWEPLSEVAKRGRYVCERQVLLTKRTANIEATIKTSQGNKAKRSRVTNRPRKQRWATLHIEASTVTILRPRRLTDRELLPRALTVNIVRVHEPVPPTGEEAVEWLLMTTEPVDSQSDVEAVVDWYRRRWRIEEYFRALKTGCAYEKRQLESRPALLKTLALLMPIAWQLLALRDRAESTPDQPASLVLSQRQLDVLRGLSKRPLATAPNLEEVLLAIAAQGGHLRRNGAPGWQTLGRGLEKLWWAEVGYVIAVQQVGRAAGNM